MRKQITIGLLVLGAGYSMATLAGEAIPPPPPPPPPSGNIGSPAFGTDNFTLNGINANGRGPGSLGYSLYKIFYGGPDLHFNSDGLLVDPSGAPFTGTTLTGEVFKDGKKQ